MNQASTRYLNDQALESLAQDAAESATVDRTGEIHLSPAIAAEVSELQLWEQVKVYQHVSLDEKFQTNCRRIGIDPDQLTYAPTWARERARKARINRNMDRFGLVLFVIGVVLYFVAKTYLYGPVR